MGLTFLPTLPGLRLQTWCARTARTRVRACCILPVLPLPAFRTSSLRATHNRTNASRIQLASVGPFAMHAQAARFLAFRSCLAPFHRATPFPRTTPTSCRRHRTRHAARRSCHSSPYAVRRRQTCVLPCGGACRRGLRAPSTHSLLACRVYRGSLLPRICAPHAFHTLPAFLYRRRLPTARYFKRLAYKTLLLPFCISPFFYSRLYSTVPYSAHLSFPGTTYNIAVCTLDFACGGHSSRLFSWPPYLSPTSCRREPPLPAWRTAFALPRLPDLPR